MRTVEASDPARLSRLHRRIVLVLILLLIAVIAATVYSIRAVRARRNAASPLIGTWRGELGNVLNFRPDGTGRFRFSTGPAIGYMEWSINESGELAVWQFSARNSIGAWMVRGLLAAGIAPPTDRYEVLELSPTRMRLRCSHVDPKTRKPVTSVITFTRVKDRNLETSP
ncbi:MAG: hypothetical protein ACYC6Y_07430 [Thermoguttaceae bacterium]